MKQVSITLLRREIDVLKKENKKLKKQVEKLLSQLDNSKEKTEDDYYEEGRQAFWDGQSIEDCPCEGYFERSWKNGYESASYSFGEE